MTAAVSDVDGRHARRNAATVGGTAVVLGLLLLFPTSTNRSVAPRRPGVALAPAGVAAPATGPATRTVTVNGAAVDTRYGLVQVQVTVRGGRLVTAKAIDYPRSSGQDEQINGQAIPILEQETLTAQSSRVDTVSGATYTSDGYRRSLQAALDTAHLH